MAQGPMQSRVKGDQGFLGDTSHVAPMDATKKNIAGIVRVGKLRCLLDENNFVRIKNVGFSNPIDLSGG